MAIVVESGAAVANANSFVTVAECDGYHLDRANTSWTGSGCDATAKAAALIRAGQYLNGLMWKGIKTANGNAMSWPRYNVPNPNFGDVYNFEIVYIASGDEYIASNVVPQEVKDAQCEAALIELIEARKLFPEQDRGGQVLSERIGEIAITYAPHASATTLFTAIRSLLREYLRGLSNVELGRG